MAERRFKVVWSDAAALILRRFTSWVAAGSPTDAATLMTRLRKRIVAVVGVFDGRRELEDVLLERLTAPPED